MRTRYDHHNGFIHPSYGYPSGGFSNRDFPTVFGDTVTSVSAHYPVYSVGGCTFSGVNSSRGGLISVYI